MKDDKIWKREEVQIFWWSVLILMKRIKNYNSINQQNGRDLTGHIRDKKSENDKKWLKVWKSGQTFRK